MLESNCMKPKPMTKAMMTMSITDTSELMVKVRRAPNMASAEVEMRKTTAMGSSRLNPLSERRDVDAERVAVTPGERGEVGGPRAAEPRRPHDGLQQYVPGGEESGQVAELDPQVRGPPTEGISVASSA